MHSLGVETEKERAMDNTVACSLQPSVINYNVRVETASDPSIKQTSAMSSVCTRDGPYLLLNRLVLTWCMYQVSGFLRNYLPNHLKTDV